MGVDARGLALLEVVDAQLCVCVRVRVCVCVCVCVCVYANVQRVKITTFSAHVLSFTFLRRRGRRCRGRRRVVVNIKDSVDIMDLFHELVEAEQGE